jgi:hypothetical protein
LAALVPFTGGSSSSDQASNDLISNLGGDWLLKQV